MDPYVIFDLGSVLLRGEPEILFRKLFAGDEAKAAWCAGAVCTPEWNHRHDMGVVHEDNTVALIERFPEHASEVRAFSERWEEMMPGPIDGSVEILNELHERGHPLYVLSNFSAEKFPVIRSKHGFFDLFDGFVISGEIGTVKPEKGIYEHLFRTFSLDPLRCLFIDDRPENIAAGKALGMDGIVFESPIQLRRELVSRGLL